MGRVITPRLNRIQLIADIKKLPELAGMLFQDPL
jgi:hypothetical protein